MAKPTKRSMRVLKVIEKLSTATHPQTLSQLSLRTGVPKSSLMRLLDDLVYERYVIHMPGKKGYALGPQTYQLALATLRAPELLQACRVVLERLVGVTGETCNLNALVEDSVKYLARVESSGHLRLQLRLPVGTHVPLHCTASGKLFLAFTSEPVLSKLLDRLDLIRMTPQTVTERDRLEASLPAIRAQKIGIDDEEFIVGMVAVAVPILDKAGTMVAALACHAPTAQASLQHLKNQVPHLRSAARELSDILLSY